MTAPDIWLHSKLYRAKAIDRAMQLAIEENADLSLSKRRQGDYYVINISGLEWNAATEFLAAIADAALLMTAEDDKR